MYEVYLNTLCINQEVFYDHLKLLSYANFQKWVQRGKLNRLRTKGNGRTGLIEFASIPEDEKNLIIKKYGNYYTQNDRTTFTNQLVPDENAQQFFNTYKDDLGESLGNAKIKQHICEAEILNLYKKIIENYEVKCQSLGKRTKKGQLKKKLSKIINEIRIECYPHSETKKYPHSLPKNWRSLDRKLEDYINNSYDCLIHKNKGKKHALKIKGANAKWLIAKYSLPNKIVVPNLANMYAQEAAKQGWPELDESTIYKWLYKDEIRRKWVISRDGMEAFRKDYGHKLVRDKDDWFPNCYWAIDGTKIDWMHFQDNDHGFSAKLKIDPVIDVYSEKIIGWSFSETENHIDHFTAVKMAVNNAQCKPYLFTYDGQSGHTADRMQALYNKLIAKQGGTHYKHAAYRHGSPVEQLFNRLQQQVINKFWFSDKQSPTVRTLNNKPNKEFILENKKLLPTKEQLINAWLLCVQEWNESIHPKFKDEGLTRSQVYTHEPLMHEPVNYLDQIDMFWVYTAEPSKYKGNGIEVTISKKDYHFEVYNVNGDIDLRFRERYVGERFYVRYDPEQLDNYVSLYHKLPNGDLQFVADAQPVRKQQQIPALMKPGDKAQFDKDYNARKLEEKTAKANTERIQRETGITPDALIDEQNTMIKFAGKLPKKQRALIEEDEWLTDLN